MRKGMFALAAVGLLAVGSVAACGGDGDDSGSGSSGASSAPGKVGVILPDTASSQRWSTADNKFLKEAFDAAGVQADIQNAQGDKSQFQTIADGMISSGVKVLIIVNLDSGTGKAVLDKAKAAGIATIDYDRLTLNGDANYYVSFDNVKVGRMQAEYLLNQAPKGNYLLIGGSQTDNNAKLLRQGQMEMLKPAIAAGSVKIVGEGWADNWSEEAAKALTEQGLTKARNNLAAIVASNDRTALGAIDALTANNLAGKVFVSGQDAELAAMKRIVAGTQSMTVYKPLRPLARMAAGAAINMAQGQTEEGVVTVNNGKKDVPARLLEPISVDKETMDRTVLADGYHTRNEVYGQ